MSELITAQNLELVIKKNHEIKEEVLAQAIRLQTNPSIMKVASAPQLALCQLVREGKINIDDINEYRKDVRKITYSKEQDDYAIVLVTELVNNELFAELVSDKTVHIIF